MQNLVDRGRESFENGEKKCGHQINIRIIRILAEISITKASEQERFNRLGNGSWQSGRR